MSYDYFDDPHSDDYAYEDYVDNLLKENMEDYIYANWQNISEPSVIKYLAENGDEVQRRIDLCVNNARELHSQGFFRESVINSVTAIELIIRFMLLRPIVQGVFLSDEWAEILAERVATGRTAEDRTLLPSVLKKWGIDIQVLHDSLWIHQKGRAPHNAHNALIIKEIDCERFWQCHKYLEFQEVMKEAVDGNHANISFLNRNLRREPSALKPGTSPPSTQKREEPIFKA